MKFVHTFGFQGCANKWINANKLKLDIVSLEWLPLAIVQFFNHNRIFLIEKNAKAMIIILNHILKHVTK